MYIFFCTTSHVPAPDLLQPLKEQGLFRKREQPVTDVHQCGAVNIKPWLQQVPRSEPDMPMCFNILSVCVYLKAHFTSASTLIHTLPPLEIYPEGISVGLSVTLCVHILLHNHAPSHPPNLYTCSPNLLKAPAFILLLPALPGCQCTAIAISGKMKMTGRGSHTPLLPRRGLHTSLLPQSMRSRNAGEGSATAHVQNPKEKHEPGHSIQIHQVDCCYSKL